MPSPRSLLGKIGPVVTDCVPMVSTSAGGGQAVRRMSGEHPTPRGSGSVSDSPGWDADLRADLSYPCGVRYYEVERRGVEGNALALLGVGQSVRRASPGRCGSSAPSTTIESVPVRSRRSRNQARPPLTSMLCCQSSGAAERLGQYLSEQVRTVACLPAPMMDGPGPQNAGWGPTARPPLTSEAVTLRFPFASVPA